VPAGPVEAAPTEVKWAQTLIVLGILSVGVYLLRSFLLPLAMAGIYAMVLNPLLVRLLARGWTRSRAALALTMGFSVVFLVPFLGLTLAGARNVMRWLEGLKDFGKISTVDELAQQLGLETVLLRAQELIHNLDLPVEQINSAALSGAQSALTGLATLIQGLARDIPFFLLSNLVIVLALFFFLWEGTSLVARIRSLSPFDRRSTDSILTYTDQLSRAVVLAALAAGGVQAVILALASLVAGVGDWMIVGVLAFVFSFVPVVGSLPISLALLLMAAVSGQMSAVVILAVAIVIVGLSDNIVRPLVLKGGAELHPLLGFIGAFGGLQLFGFYGLFTGPVLVGLAIHLLELRWGSSGEV
jgi:predicted PurR-regulated permease PerM